jgi:hypothetical protein
MVKSIYELLILGILDLRMSTSRPEAIYYKFWQKPAGRQN